MWKENVLLEQCHQVSKVAAAQEVKAFCVLQVSKHVDGHSNFSHFVLSATTIWTSKLISVVTFILKDVYIYLYVPTSEPRRRIEGVSSTMHKVCGRAILKIFEYEGRGATWRHPSLSHWRRFHMCAASGTFTRNFCNQGILLTTTLRINSPWPSVKEILKYD